MSRKSGLETLKALKDWDFEDRDSPTPEDDARQQSEADDIMTQRWLAGCAKPSRYTFTEAQRLLRASECVYDDSGKIAWLQKAGYTRVCVKGSERRVPLDCADIKHVRAMYGTELSEVRKVVYPGLYRK